MFVVRCNDAMQVVEYRIATYAVYIQTFLPLDAGWIFVDGDVFLDDSEIGDFAANYSTYFFDSTGVLRKNYGDIDNDLSDLSYPWINL